MRVFDFLDTKDQLMHLDWQRWCRRGTSQSLEEFKMSWPGVPVLISLRKAIDKHVEYERENPEKPYLDLVLNGDSAGRNYVI